MHLDELNGPWEICLKVVHWCVAWAHIYRLVGQLITNNEIFLQVYHWAIHSPLLAVLDLGHVFPILGPFPLFNIHSSPRTGSDRG